MAVTLWQRFEYYYYYYYYYYLFIYSFIYLLFSLYHSFLSSRIVIDPFIYLFIVYVVAQLVECLPHKQYVVDLNPAGATLFSLGKEQCSSDLLSCLGLRSSHNYNNNKTYEYIKITRNATTRKRNQLIEVQYNNVNMQHANVTSSLKFSTIMSTCNTQM